jgi:hypothetical protein
MPCHPTRNAQGIPGGNFHSQEGRAEIGSKFSSFGFLSSREVDGRRLQIIAVSVLEDKAHFNASTQRCHLEMSVQ